MQLQVYLYAPFGEGWCAGGRIYTRTFLADRTGARLLAWYCRPSVCVEVHCGRTIHPIQQKCLNIWIGTRSSAIAVIADRTACSILTLFIVTAASRPLNKNIRLLSVRGSNNYCGSASSIRSPHTSVCTRTRRLQRVTVQRHRVIVDKRADSQPESHRHLWRF